MANSRGSDPQYNGDGEALGRIEPGTDVDLARAEISPPSDRFSLQVQTLLRGVNPKPVSDFRRASEIAAGKMLVVPKAA
ncbi:MAG: hypothetical protein D6808_00655 [Candidatus Dadabacteria bacterium]|nr:MAG: hypothetical protein D6808_00655 [Candidatus Dadabacteria bacterium]